MKKINKNTVFTWYICLGYLLIPPSPKTNKQTKNKSPHFDSCLSVKKIYISAIILKGRSGSAVPRQLCADAGCWSGTRRQRQRQTDAVPPPDHTQRGCSAPLLRYRHYDDQNPGLSRDRGHAPRWTRTHRPTEDGTRTPLRRGFVGPARISSFPSYSCQHVIVGQRRQLCGTVPPGEDPRQRTDRLVTPPTPTPTPPQPRRCADTDAAR